MLTHRQRMQACLSDDSTLDRTPVALWRHFPVDDQTPESLAAATVDFQRRYDFDLVKVTPASSFSIKDWGADDVWEGHTEGTRRYTHRVVKEPADWENLPVLDPCKSEHLAAQLECLRLIRSAVGPDTPVLQTVFSPLAQAKNLSGGDLLIVHLRLYPNAVMKGLATIAETTCRFVEASIETGIDGIFYAVQHAQAGLLTFEEYLSFGLPLDLQTLQPATSLWCNLLHLHGLNVYFDLITFFPDRLFPIVNWHDRETYPSLRQTSEVLKTSEVSPPPVLCGGVSQHTIVFGGSAQVREEAEDAIAQTGGRRLLLGTGCVVPVIAPHGNITAVIRAARQQPARES
jgi:uroporphyrinogen decarboxylase